MNAKRLLLEKIKDGSFALLTDGEIAHKLHLGKREALAVREMLNSLVREGELLSDSRYRFGTAKQFGAKTGKFSSSGRGFGFFTPDDGSGDLFIPYRSVRDAYHGDSVLAIPVRGRSDDEGEILAVLSRGYSELVGTFHTDGKLCFLTPDEKRFGVDIAIPRAKSLGCREGDKAVAKIFYQNPTPSGEIAERLGQSGDLFTEELALIRTHGLREEFPAPVLSEAERVAAAGIAESDLSGREDLRGSLIITVDGEDTRDIDDAISVEKRDGKYYLGVHIADVSHYVKTGSALDREAFARGTSVYFPDRVLPMLPTPLSNGVCSLNEGEDRLTLSCFMTVDSVGRVLQRRVAPSVIRSRHRMTYTAVESIRTGGKEAKRYPDLIPFVKTAEELTLILKRARESRGGIALDVKEAKILYENGKIAIPDHVRTLAHEMIEQFMVLANESVATLMTEKGVPFVYRIHERPSEEKAKDLAEFLRGAGIAPRFDPATVSPRDYCGLLRSIEGSPVYSVVNRVMLRSMMKARYSPENVGHFGLASDCYCHFTSPIRRYPDLSVHRIVKDALRSVREAREKNSPLVRAAAEQSSLCERTATDAERDVDALYLVAYMQDKIGQEFEGAISGVTSFGLFAELKNTVEGFIPVETLPDDFYTFEEKRFLLRGTKHAFRLGEKVRVGVAAVDWGARRIQFSLIGKIN